MQLENASMFLQVVNWSFSAKLISCYICRQNENKLGKVQLNFIKLVGKRDPKVNVPSADP